MKFILMLILAIVTSEVVAKRKAIKFYKKPDFRVNERFVKLTFDVNSINLSKPVDFLPEIKIELLQDIKRAVVLYKMQNIDDKTVIINQKINVCDISRQRGLALFMISLAFKNMINFELKCPFKKRSNYRIKPVNLNQFTFAIPNILQNQRIEINHFVTNGSETMPYLSINVYMMQVQVDD